MLKQQQEAIGRREAIILRHDLFKKTEYNGAVTCFQMSLAHCPPNYVHIKKINKKMKVYHLEAVSLCINEIK